MLYCVIFRNFKEEITPNGYGLDVAVFENRQSATAAKFINKSSLFILLPGVVRRPELKPNSEQEVENMSVAILPNRLLPAVICLPFQKALFSFHQCVAQMVS